MKLGLSSYTFGWAVGVRGHESARPLDEHGLLDKCQELGVKLLQVGDNLPLHIFSPARLKSFAARADREGVEIEVGARGLTLPRIREYVAIARELNANLIRFVIDEADYQPTSEQVRDVLVHAQSAFDGLTLAIENHDRFRAKILRQIIEDVGSERIGICLDTANSLGAGEGLDSVLASLASITVNLHIKDFQIERLPHSMGFLVTGRPAGTGLLDLSSVLNQLSPFQRCQTAILELWTPPEPHIEQTISKEASWAVQSLKNLKSFFA